MIRFTLAVLGLMVVALITRTTAHAQLDDCPAEVDVILDAVEEACAALSRNQVCYGNQQIEAETLDNSPVFSQNGDIIPINELVSLRTHPLSLDDNIWGIAVFSVQTNLPDTLPGQNVTLIVFGDAETQPDPDAPQDYQMPMQAFFLRTGIGIPACNTVPAGGVLIQNPRGTAVNLMVNGFELQVGSTALLSAENDEELTVSTLDGSVRVTSDGVEQDVPAGFSLTVVREAAPETPEPDPETVIRVAEILPESLPEIGEPSAEAIGLLACASSGGVNVTAGSTLTMRGGWADYDLTSVIEFAATTPPTVDYDGDPLTYSYRAGPDPWTGSNGPGFQINWYWQVENITTGTHRATWTIAGETVVCEIRAG